MDGRLSCADFDIDRESLPAISDANFLYVPKTASRADTDLPGCPIKNRSLGPKFPNL